MTDIPPIKVTNVVADPNPTRRTVSPNPPVDAPLSPPCNDPFSKQDQVPPLTQTPSSQTQQPQQPRQTPFWNTHAHRPPPLRTIQTSSVLPDHNHPHATPLSTAEMMRTGSDPSPTSEMARRDRQRMIDRESDRERRFNEEKEELTTKGRKRKRLAKACSACHKNKRRCDGFAPCGNCEFSSRPCLYLNAQGEPIPPPRTRDSSTAPISRKEEKSETKGDGKDDGDRDNWGKRGSDDNDRKDDVSDWERRVGVGRGMPILSPVEVVERDPGLSAELVDIFIRRIPPYIAMFHQPTLQHRIYTSSISPLLLDAIYAFAARLCENPAFIATYPPQHPPWLRGEPFADRARISIERIIESRRSWSEEERRDDRGSWEETEFVQALSLLSTYGNCLRRNRQALYFLDIGLSILRPDHPSQPLPPPSARLHATLGTLEYLTLIETRNRTFWLLVLADLCVAANGRPRQLMDHEMGGVPLPGKEEYWTRYGGGGSTDQIGVRDGLVQGSAGIKAIASWSPAEAAVGELGHVLRILSIFCDIMTVANNGGAGAPDTRQIPASQHEHALKAWALSLPPSLRFDEPNLCLNIAKIHSPVSQTSLTGWLYTYMHAVAECGMFYLQAAATHIPPGLMAKRQGQAVENLAVILHSLGEKGREGPLMTFPILVVSNWQDHVRSAPTPPTAAQTILDDRIAQWWAEIYREWGFEREPVQDRGFYQVARIDPAASEPESNHASSSISSQSESRFSRHLDPIPSSSLGLYQSTSPILPQGPPETPHSASSLNLPTPSISNGVGSSRYLPPIRPRASSSTFPQFAAGNIPKPSNEQQRHLPSLNTEHSHYNYDSHRMSLPSLSAELRSLSQSNGTSSTERPGKSKLSPRRYDEDESRYSAGQSNHRPPSPRSGVRHPVEPPDGMTGIAALLSAVEETQREKIALGTA